MTFTHYQLARWSIWGARLSLWERAGRFISREWLVCGLAVALVVSSILLRRLPVLSLTDLQVVGLLGSLLLTVKGLEECGLIVRVAETLEAGVLPSVKLILGTFFLSMVITNDAALVVIVPLTLTLKVENKEILVVLEALAANAGSALTPIGNPQNLFIYWFYRTSPESFITTIAPFSVAFLIFILVAALLAPRPRPTQVAIEKKPVGKRVYIYLCSLACIALATLHIVPVILCALVVVYAVLADRRSLRIDFGLLATFLCLFGLTSEVQTVIPRNLEHANHVFLVSALMSQLVSNVPTTLFLAKFTSQWQALLWGSNVGGFGSPIGSLANLIAIRLFLGRQGSASRTEFMGKFLGYGYAAFFLGCALYWVLAGL